MEDILQCDDSLEGVFTAVYEAYRKKLNPTTTRIQVGQEENIRLFATYHPVQSDCQKTEKVARTICREFGVEGYQCICQCLASANMDKAQWVYQSIVVGLTMKKPKELMGNLGNDHIRKVYELSRATKNEILHLEGFLRFQELENKILFSKIGPKNNILSFLAPHFQDRLPQENFMIYDEYRSLVVVHPAGKKWSLVTGDMAQLQSEMNISEQEIEYQELFRYFCKKVSIGERENKKLQNQMLPLRFQKFMIEFS